MTVTSTRLPTRTSSPDVYLPQEDTALLIETMRASGRARGSRVVDLCTGSGAVAIAAARLGADTVHAVDLSAAAVEYARAAAVAAGQHVSLTCGDLSALTGTFDLVTCNPPYVPTPASRNSALHPGGPTHAWDAGADGRAVLDVVCAHAPALLAPGGSLLLVHSEFSDATATLGSLTAGGLCAEVVAERTIPFGPVMSARAGWFEGRGMLERGRRIETLVAIAARAPESAADADIRVPAGR
ncbi:HemK2/MTQ2 family protein methyltransferase [Gordonia soli]|uniref:Methyltransferase small domain-containing protein n=1 Tax=Gordonia soli NBRC 108243 TaxID=1223545 RepID=M0QD07_9ACTN|nr:HemK2/MTQ2 family protein methyltransferase [Gordonia soli]GAC66493.1 hypothetical protein GS4_02_02040 [Gordonia soli NBRC 108243]